MNLIPILYLHRSQPATANQIREYLEAWWKLASKRTTTSRLVMLEHLAVDSRFDEPSLLRWLPDKAFPIRNPKDPCVGSVRQRPVGGDLLGFVTSWWPAEVMRQHVLRLCDPSAHLTKIIYSGPPDNQALSIPDLDSDIICRAAPTSDLRDLLPESVGTPCAMIQGGTCRG
jgi:hypothetical protein